MDYTTFSWTNFIEMWCLILQEILKFNCLTSALTLVITTIVIFNMHNYQVKSQLVGMKWGFKHQDLQMFGHKLNKYD